MEGSYKTLSAHIDKLLTHINKPSNLHVNYELSQILDDLTIPENAKLAILSIDTAMRHLDRINFYNYERDAILIGDLLSAYFYQVVAELENKDFQQQMSECIIQINELKSYLQHTDLQHSPQTRNQTIYKVETLLFTTLNNIYTLNKDISVIENQIMNQLKVDQLTYLVHYTEDDINNIIHELQNKYTINGVNKDGK